MITNPIFSQSGSGNGISFVQGLVRGLVGLGFVIGTVTFFFILILGAIQWISSGGDKQGLEGARNKITNALIGIVILFALFAFIHFFQKFFHVTIMTLDIGSLKIQ